MRKDSVAAKVLLQVDCIKCGRFRQQHNYVAISTEDVKNFSRNK